MGEVLLRNPDNTAREIEDLRRMKIFSEEDLARMIKVRKHMEAKINGYFCKNVDDLKQYIEYESLILRKIRKFRDKKKIPADTSSVDYAIIRRIRRLYETALQRFPSVYSLHQGFFEFCKKYAFTTTASQAVDKMLKMFPLNPDVWKLAADWFHKVNDVHRALQTINNGLTVNPESQELYLKAIELELGQKQNDQVSVEDQEEWERMRCVNIQNYISLILDNVNDLEFVIHIVSLLEKHKSTLEAQRKVLEHLFKNHCSEDSVWHMMAQRERKGLHFVTDPNERPRCQDNFTKSCVVYCVDKYKQGLSVVVDEKKRKLWFQYIETLLEIKEEHRGSIALSCKDFLKSALGQAHSEKCLEERHYIVWLDDVSDDDARKILEEATAFHPTNEELWTMRIRHEIMTNKVRRVESIFQAALDALQENSVNIWLMRLRFHRLSSEIERIEAIYEEGIKQAENISNILKPKYLEWIGLHKDIVAARKKYREIAVRKPYSKDLHDVMSKLEMSEMSTNYNRLQEVHELATSQFGSEDFNVILNYVKFILYRKPDNFQQKLKNLYADAERRLPPLQFQQFRGQYQLLLAER